MGFTLSGNLIIRAYLLVTRARNKWNKQEKAEAFNTRKSNPSDGSFLRLIHQSNLPNLSKVRDLIFCHSLKVHSVFFSRSFDS